MLHRSTFQLLRFHFSFFLLPVYLFALSQVLVMDVSKAMLIFFILHLLVYPASNGYNSYMDRDETPIGGIRNPLQPTPQLFWITVIMDVAAVVLSLLIGIYFASGMLLYILASRAYSYRGIRLKKYAIVGYATVIVFQGAVTFWLVYYGSNRETGAQVPFSGMLASSLLVGGFYPLTQIYQHEADKRDGVQTISRLLGYKGTFVFTAIVYSFAMATLAYHFIAQLEMLKFVLLATTMSPILVYFFIWAARVWKNTDQANFNNTMRMNILASVFTNLAFIIILIWRLFE